MGSITPPTESMRSVSTPSARPGDRVILGGMDVIWWVILVTAVILVAGGISFVVWLHRRQREQARRDSPKSDRRGGATIRKEPPRPEGQLRRGPADS